MKKNAKAVTVMGIDPGSQITGVGIIRAQGSELSYLFCESIKLPKGELSSRLRLIYQRVDELIKEFAPDVVALEKVFLARNPQSALVLGHARGAAMLGAANNNIVIAEYSATEIKKTVVGKGRASKDQIQHMVRVLLGLRSNPEVDAADALACAICHVQHSQLASLSSEPTKAQQQWADLLAAKPKAKRRVK